MRQVLRKFYKAKQSLLVERRKAARLTQSSLAKILGVDQSFISKVERGERRLDAIELIFYCRALGENPANFIELLSSQCVKEIDER